MLIGKHGKALKEIYQKTNCYIFVSDKVNANNERMLQFSGGSGPMGVASHVEENSEEYNNMSSVDKCKQEIQSRLMKLENFAMTRKLQLCTETVLQHIEEEAPKEEQSDIFTGGKQSLLATAKNSDSNQKLKSNNIKKEKWEETKKQVQYVMTTQESQKDFLFDPYAAAYYERFQGFVPGEKQIDFQDLKWPAL